jgi:hypothetical protein
MIELLAYLPVVLTLALLVFAFVRKPSARRA